jgi:ABC-type transport system involved in cytochrome c biogenesis permease subunit
MEINHKILGVVTLLYLLVFVMHILFFAVRKAKVMSFMWLVLYATFGLHTAGLITRWVESYRLNIGHAPLSNFYESLIFYGWCLTLTIILFRKRLSYPLITGLATLVSLFFMAYASLSPSVTRQIQPLIPALQSNWLHIHVFTCFLAYAAFAISFICGTLSLVRWKGMSPSPETLEEINYSSIMVGFPLLSAGILTGAVWAHYAWGSYWSWDPKETWSLITWIIYAIVLHARFVRGWRGRRMALLSIVGFMSVIFTYFGVNFILSGLHSYAT